MRLKKAFYLALNALIHSKLRSMLTIIGIIIGIAAVVSIVSVSQGAQQQLQQNLGSLGANILTVSLGHSRAMGAGGNFRGGFSMSRSAATSTQKNLTSLDVLAIKSVPNIAYVEGTLSGRTSVTYNSKSASVGIEGVDPSVWKNFVSTDLSSGRYLTEGDTNAVVVGGSIAQNVFSGKIAINRNIVIDGKNFRIVGILEEGGSGNDNSIFMPVSSARTVLEDPEGKQFSSIQVKISNTDLANSTVNDITNKLMMERGILQSDKQDFSVVSPLEFQSQISSTLDSMSLFLAAIAAISLIVGAVGISNTMFTSVIEKTKEIGILKAIGAQNKDIMAIFVINSALLGMVGGIGGIILGIIGSGLVGGLSGASLGRISFGSAYVSPKIIVGAFLVSVIIGMIAGVIPAYRASKLKPVEALRYE